MAGMTGESTLHTPQSTDKQATAAAADTECAIKCRGNHCIETACPVMPHKTSPANTWMEERYVYRSTSLGAAEVAEQKMKIENKRDTTEAQCMSSLK